MVWQGTSVDTDWTPAGYVFSQDALSSLRRLKRRSLAIKVEGKKLGLVQDPFWVIKF